MDAALASLGSGLSGLSGLSGVIRIPSGVAPFSPTDLFGLELWLKGGSYVAGTWTDASGKGRNATQATGANQPALQAAVAEINAKPSVLADGVNDSLATAAFTAFSPYTIVLAMRQVSWTASDYVVDHNSAGALWWAQTGSSPQLVWAPGVAAMTALPIGRFGLVTLIGAPSATIANYLDSKLNATGATNAVQVNQVILFRDAGSTVWGNFEIAEYQLYSTQIGAYDRLRVENLLADTYKIPTTFSPTSISGLRLWLDASQETGYADGASVATATDRSGQTNNLTQATGANRPVFQLSARNTRSAYRGDGVNDSLESATNPLSGLSAATVFVVSRLTPASAGGVMLGTTNLGMTLELSATGAPKFYGSGVSSAAGSAIALGTWTIISGVYNGAGAANIDRLKMWVNGVEQTLAYVGTIPATLPAGASIAVLSAAGGSSPVGGDLAEVLVYNAALTPAQRQQIEGLLANKHAINAAIRPFDPLSVPNCEGWWRVDGGCDVSSEGAAIGAIYDRSGNGRPFVQATAGSKPLYRAASLNGYGTADFDGVNDFMTMVATLAQPATLFIVAKSDVNTSTARNLLDGNGVSNRWVVRANHAVNQGFLYAGTTGILVANTPTDWYVYAAIINNTGSAFYLNDQTTAGTVGTQTIGGLTLGGGYDLATEMHDGRIAEVIVYSGAISTQDRQAVSAYLEARYDLGYKEPSHPSLLANLQMWLRPSTESYADAASLTNFHDRSGHGWDLTPGTAPTFETREVNGRPVARFVVASSQYLRNTSYSGCAGGAACTMFLVHKTASVGGNRDLVGGENFRHRFSTDNTGYYWNVATAKYGYFAVTPDGNVNVLRGRFDGSQSTDATRLRIWQNRIEMTGLTLTAGIPAVMGIGNGFYMGSSPTPGSYYGGDIIEVIVYDAVLSDSDCRAIENYLSQQYNLAF